MADIAVVQGQADDLLFKRSRRFIVRPAHLQFLVRKSCFQLLL